MAPMADPAAMPTMVPVLRPFAAAVVEVEVGPAAETNTLLEDEVAIVEVEAELPGTVVDYCVDTGLVERVELLVEDVVVPRNTISPGEGIFGDPT
jgi:hypothetical protein